MTDRVTLADIVAEHRGAKPPELTDDEREMIKISDMAVAMVENERNDYRTRHAHAYRDTPVFKALLKAMLRLHRVDKMFEGQLDIFSEQDRQIESLQRENERLAAGLRRIVRAMEKNGTAKRASKMALETLGDLWDE